LIFALFASDLTYLAVLRDVEERGRDIEGCIKQWFAFVKPNFERYVEPQRKVAGRSLYLIEYIIFILETPTPFPTILTASGEHRYYRTKRSGKQSRDQ
jgi:hypothetical protein